MDGYARKTTQQYIMSIKKEKYKLRLCEPEKISGFVVIHYGNYEYKSKRVKSIKNKHWIKPDGGLWTSPVDSRLGWKEWCESEDFRVCDEWNSFKLQFLPTAKILVIDNLDDLINLPKEDKHDYELELKFNTEYVDYEKLLKLGIDAIWLTPEGQWETRLSNPANLYGWDVETVFIMNPHCCFQPEPTRAVLIEKFKIIDEEASETNNHTD